MGKNKKIENDGFGKIKKHQLYSLCPVLMLFVIMQFGLFERNEGDNEVDGNQRDTCRHIVTRGLSSGEFTMISINNLETEKKLCSYPDDQFSLINISHLLCLGILNMEADLQKAKAWIDENSDLMDWKNGYDDGVLEAFIAANMNAGIWDSTKRSSRHPTCPTYSSNKMTNGECWVRGFCEASRVDEEYCLPVLKVEKLPLECSDVGIPLSEPPRFCYGYRDFFDYINNCEIPYLTGGTEDKKIRKYYWLATKCNNGFCPNGVKMMRFFGNYSTEMKMEIKKTTDHKVEQSP